MKLSKIALIAGLGALTTLSSVNSSYSEDSMTKREDYNCQRATKAVLGYFNSVSNDVEGIRITPEEFEENFSSRSMKGYDRSYLKEIFDLLDHDDNGELNKKDICNKYRK